MPGSFWGWGCRVIYHCPVITLDALLDPFVLLRFLSPLFFFGYFMGLSTMNGCRLISGLLCNFQSSFCVLFLG